MKSIEACAHEAASLLTVDGSDSETPEWFREILSFVREHPGFVSKFSKCDWLTVLVFGYLMAKIRYSVEEKKVVLQ